MHGSPSAAFGRRLLRQTERDRRQRDRLTPFLLPRPSQSRDPSAIGTPCPSGPSTTTAVITSPSRPALPFKADVLHCHDRGSRGTSPRTGTSCLSPIRLSCLAPLGRVAALDRHVRLDAEDHAGLVGVRLHRQKHALLVLLAQPRVLSSGMVARQFLHFTVRAQR